MNHCPHLRLEYIGVQEYPGYPSLRLYHCLDCHTTTSKPVQGPPVITIRLRNDAIFSVKVQGVPFRGKVRELRSDLMGLSAEERLVGEIACAGLKLKFNKGGNCIIPPELAGQFERDPDGELVQVTEYEYDNTGEK